MFNNQNQLTDTFESFDSDGLELVVNTSTGMAYASMSAASRMLETSRGTVIRTCQDYPVITAEVVTSKGLRTCSLVEASVVFKLALIHNSALAEKMGTAGANVYLLNLAGYKITIEETTPTAPRIVLTRLELAEMIFDAETRLEKAEKQIEADSEFTNLGKMIDNTFGCLSVGEFAKVIEIGRSTYFKELRDCKIIMKNSVLPYQSMMDAGYFVVTEKIGLNNIAYATALVTAKGQTYLAKRHQQYLDKELVMVQMERMVSII